MGFSLSVQELANEMQFVSCADAGGGYFYVLAPSGKMIGKVDIPKSACRTDKIAKSYFNESGTYRGIVANYQNQNQAWKEFTISGATGTGICPKGDQYARPWLGLGDCDIGYIPSSGAFIQGMGNYCVCNQSDAGKTITGQMTGEGTPQNMLYIIVGAAVLLILLLRR